MNRHDDTIRCRDDHLGAALSMLDVPEHRPGFDADLRRRIAAERAVAIRRTRVRWGLRVAAAAAVVAVLVVALGLPRTDTADRIGGADVATAAVVKQHLREALATMRSLSGVLVEDGPTKGDEQRWHFTLDAEGDVRLEGPASGEVTTYDASAGVARSAQRSASAGGDTIFYAERRGVAPGPPDQGPPTWILPDRFAAFVRAALAAGDPAVHEVAYAGRAAWRLEVDTVPNAIVPELSGDRFAITVDRTTGMPVRVVETRQGSFIRELRIEGLAVDRPLPPQTFRLRFPPNAEVMPSDDGFRRVELARVADAVGYAPLVPAWAPAGYRLAEVGVARASGPTGKEAANPESRMVVSLSYRRGLDQFLVTTRLRGSGVWDDPLATGEGFVDTADPVRVDSGALRGIEARLVVVPRGIPHLWALTDDLVVTVGGDLGRAELLRVAASLERR